LINEILILSFKIIEKKFIDIFGVISQTNIATLILSVVTIVLMYLLKFEINDRFKQKLPMPIPTELIMVLYLNFIIFFYLIYHLAIVMLRDAGVLAYKGF
jgi:hypothetical protein